MNTSLPQKLMADLEVKELEGEPATPEICASSHCGYDPATITGKNGQTVHYVFVTIWTNVLPPGIEPQRREFVRHECWHLNCYQAAEAPYGEIQLPKRERWFPPADGFPFL
ncbi:MAG: hypothetical protein ACHQUB_01415 [Candidatus Saccharimonadia bacterium]